MRSRMSSAACRISRRLPYILCSILQHATGATVACSVDNPQSGGLTVGTSAHFLPCGDPFSFGYTAWSVTASAEPFLFFLSRNFCGYHIFISVSGVGRARQTWTATSPAAPPGLSLGFGSVATRAANFTSCEEEVVLASAVDLCCNGRAATCCNDCPFSMSRVPMHVSLITGTHDFSDLC